MSRMILAALALVILLSGVVTADEQFTVRERVRPRSVEVSFDFREAKFSDIIEYISKESGRNIIIDGDIEDTVTLRLVGIKWRRALDMVCQQVGAVVEEEGEDVIRISQPVTINFELEDAPLTKVVGTIARLAEATVIIGPNVSGTVTAQFYDVPWTQALDYIVRTSGYIVLKEGKVFRIMDPAALEMQLMTRVFQLRYVQPPEEYVANLDSKFARRKEEAKAMSVEGVAEVLGLPSSTAGGRPQRATRSSGGGGESSQFALLNAIKRVASRKGSAEYIPSTNSLVVTDTEPNMKQIAELIEAMDREPMQVFIDVKFISTNMANRFRTGVDWASGIKVSSSYGSVASRLPFNLGKGGWEDSLSASGDGPTDADIAAGITDLVDRSGPFTFGILDFRGMTTTLEMFASDEGSQLKQSPQLLVLDNHQATIFVGETIRFAETDSASNQSGGVEVGIREAASSPVDTGFQLLVRPHIVAGDDKVILTVIPKAESLSGTGDTIPGFDDFTNGTATIQLPRVQSSTLVTKLILGDGMTAVLGGMIEESESDTERKVPFLGDIPVVGWAFKWKSKLKARNNLLIFLTVRICRSDTEVKDIYTVYGGRYGGKMFKQMDEENKAWLTPKESGYKVVQPKVVKTDM